MKDNLENIYPHTCSPIALQDIRSVNRNLYIPGYSKLEYNTRDKHLTQPNPVGEGWFSFISIIHLKPMIFYQMNLYFCHEYMSNVDKILIWPG